MIGKFDSGDMRCRTWGIVSWGRGGKAARGGAGLTPVVCVSALCLVPALGRESRAMDFVGAVYAQSNKFDGNSIVAYGQEADGTLTFIDEFFTGDLGAAFDGGEGLDPLISQDSLIATDDNRFVLTVNAGSDTITSFKVNNDFSLTMVSSASTGGVGPNSIAHFNGLIYAANIDADGVFTAEPDQQGSVTGFTLSDTGVLTPIAGSTRALGNRPSDVRFSPDGEHLLISSINAGSSALASGSTDALVVYGVEGDGTLTATTVGSAASTLPGNLDGRNLPSAIGFDVVDRGGREFVVVTEAREFRPDGSPPAFAELQTGSVSTYELNGDGSLTAIDTDVLAGDAFTDGQRTTCWIDFSPDGTTLYVSNALDSTISSFTLNDDGTLTLIEEVAAAGAPPLGTTPGEAFASSDGFIDLSVSPGGAFLYQLYGLDGTVGVYEIDVDTAALTLLDEASGILPEINTQGIVSIGVPVPEPSAVGIMALAGVGVWRRRRRVRR